MTDSTTNRAEIYAALYDWIVRGARHHFKSGNLEQAAQHCQSAANSAAYHRTFGRLVDYELEDILIKIGKALPPIVYKTQPSTAPRFLHVLTEGYDIGGHTPLCLRWISACCRDSSQRIVITNQKGPLPKIIKNIETDLKIEISVLDSAKDILQRSIELRDLAYSSADYVVLHVHSWDVTPIIAFALPGGPRVIFLNHAYHLFWLGATISDLVLDLNCASQTVTKTVRGIERSRLIPIPLHDSTISLEEKNQIRSKFRHRYKIPENAVVLLSIGSAYKYEPVDDVDFCAAARSILIALGSAYIVVVGLKPTGQWARLQEETAGRFIPVGPSVELSGFHAMSDLYLESFPFTSLTAMLEAALSGLPCVRSPLLVPELYRSHGTVFAETLDPPTIEAFHEITIRLVHDRETREQAGRQISESIQQTHCLPSWKNILDNALMDLPSLHMTYLGTGMFINSSSRDYWMKHEWSNSKIFVPPDHFCYSYPVDQQLLDNLMAIPDLGLGFSKGSIYEYLFREMKIRTLSALKRMRFWTFLKALIIVTRILIDWRIRGKWF